MIVKRVKPANIIMLLILKINALKIFFAKNIVSNVNNITIIVLNVII